jgi:hypothetical protein
MIEQDKLSLHQGIEWYSDPMKTSSRLNYKIKIATKKLVFWTALCIFYFEKPTSLVPSFFCHFSLYPRFLFHYRHSTQKKKTQW